MFIFLKKGWKVHSISKHKPKKSRKIKGVKYILCDIRNKKALNKNLSEHYDYIVNSSGYVDHSRNRSILQTHFLGCKNLIYKFKNKMPKKFIQIGSSIEYGNQKSPQKENLLKSKYLFSIWKCKTKNYFFFIIFI